MIQTANPSYPDLALGNIINPHLGQAFESIPGIRLLKQIGFIAIDPTDPRTIHPIRIPYTGDPENVKLEDRLYLTGRNVLYGTGIRVPRGVSLTGITSLSARPDPSDPNSVTFPHAPRELYSALLGTQAGAMNATTAPAAALLPFWKVDSVQDVKVDANPFATTVLTAPSNDAMMVVQSNLPIQVVGNRDKILRVVVEFYTLGLASVSSPDALWGYNNNVIDS